MLAAEAHQFVVRAGLDDATAVDKLMLELADAPVCDGGRSPRQTERPW
ncbi:hypothetical protein [Streptomyces sp. NPDC002671]